MSADKATICAAIGDSVAPTHCSADIATNCTTFRSSEHAAIRRTLEAALPPAYGTAICDSFRCSVQASVNTTYCTTFQSPQWSPFWSSLQPALPYAFDTTVSGAQHAADLSPDFKPL